MNGTHGRNANGVGETDPLVIVRVADAVDPTLTQRSAAVYESPPQKREQAMILVRLLLGFAAAASNGDARWTAAIAGGRRVVTLSEARTR